MKEAITWQKQKETGYSNLPCIYFNNFYIGYWILDEGQSGQLYCLHWTIPLIMKRKIIQRWSTILLISTKQTITCHLNWTQWTHKRLWHMMLEMQVLAWNRYTNVDVFNCLMGSQPHVWINLVMCFQKSWFFVIKKYKITNLNRQPGKF
jgi:hypothetical protein